LELDELLLSNTSQPILSPPLLASLRVKLDKMNKVTLDLNHGLFFPLFCSMFLWGLLIYKEMGLGVVAL
jgi:hypothetical protein